VGCAEFDYSGSRRSTLGAGDLYEPLREQQWVVRLGFNAILDEVAHALTA